MQLQIVDHECLNFMASVVLEIFPRQSSEIYELQTGPCLNEKQMTQRQSLLLLHIVQLSLSMYLHSKTIYFTVGIV